MMGWMTKYEREVGEQFERDVATHEMKVLHEDGLYRHVRFMRPNRSAYWFDLITWPGSLVIKGDMDSFTFSRQEDMFEFFRARKGWRPHETINPGYWAEKTPHQTVTQDYSEEKFRRTVVDAFVEAVKYGNAPRGLGKAVREEILDSYEISYEEGARRTLEEFVFDPGAGIVKGAEFRFTDTWEWNFKDWNYQYLWCCNAIQWGVWQYDKARAADAESVEAVA